MSRFEMSHSQVRNLRTPSRSIIEEKKIMVPKKGFYLPSFSQISDFREHRLKYA